MRKFLAIGVTLASILALNAAAPALAQDSNDGKAVVGATAGGVTAGTIGFLLGGPLGAIIGGWTGAVIGANAAVSEDSVRFAGEHPVDPIYLDDSIDVGFTVGDNVTVYPIDGDADHGYFYANGRVWIVDLNTHQVVQSPGFTIRNDDVAYVKAHRVDSVQFNGDLTVGGTFDGNINLIAIPDNRDFSYVYVGDQPVLVDNHTRTIVWIG